MHELLAQGLVRGQQLIALCFERFVRLFLRVCGTLLGLGCVELRVQCLELLVRCAEVRVELAQGFGGSLGSFGCGRSIGLLFLLTLFFCNLGTAVGSQKTNRACAQCACQCFLRGLTCYAS